VKRCLLLLAGCPELGAPQPWIDAAAIDGALAPELVLDRFDAPAGERLRVVSWNVHFGADVDALAVGLDDPALAGADVVLLQEIEAYPARPTTSRWSAGASTRSIRAART
jgi:hypothetical protein